MTHLSPKRTRARFLHLALATAVAWVNAGCVDSRWFDEQAAKKHALARARPASLAVHDSRNGATRVAVVRAYATRSYAAETVHWEAQFDQLLDDANRVLGPQVGMTLENGGTSLWSPTSGERQPNEAVKDLESEDTGDGAQWVVGFVQSVPSVVTDYHLLGVARPFTKYFVLRGSADPDELGRLNEGFGEAESQRLYSERRHHKIVAVFLHELAHTLGAVHRTAKDTIMSPVYDTRESGFDAATTGLLQITTPEVLAGKPWASAPGLVAYFEKNDAGWVPTERDVWVETLRDVAAKTASVQSAQPARAEPAPATPIAPAPGSVATAAFTTLSPDDAATYRTALDVEKKGDAKGAWQTALPLFEKYPRVVEVQKVRCRLAKLQHFFRGVAEAHCERLVGLAGEDAAND